MGYGVRVGDGGRWRVLGWRGGKDLSIMAVRFGFWDKSYRRKSRRLCGEGIGGLCD